MARSTTLTFTTAEMALLFSIVSAAMDDPPPHWSKGVYRVARSVHAKTTAALIATQAKEEAT